MKKYNIIGIVAEYNPFHNGHKIHIEKSKKENNNNIIIAFMSGNFVQRGETAIFDKWTRTKAALLNGVDIVIEIPVYFACSSAEYFSECAIRLMENTNVIDTISFGSEIGEIKYLEEISNILYNETSEFKNLFKKEISKGIPFHKARVETIKKFSNIENNIIDKILKTPNNILSIEYLKTLKKINSQITPLTIKRENSNYNSKVMEGEISSATSIRECIKKNNLKNAFQAIPKNCINIYEKEIYEGKAPILNEYISDIINYKLRTTSKNYIAEILDVTEGIENRIYKSLIKNYDFYDLCNFIKSKRYTYTKIQRILIHILLDITKKDTNRFIENGFCQYIRILGFKRSASHIITEISKKSSLPIITNIKNAKKQLNELEFKMLEKEIYSTNIYNILNPNIKNRSINIEYTTPIIII